MTEGILMEGLSFDKPRMTDWLKGYANWMYPLKEEIATSFLLAMTEGFDACEIHFKIRDHKQQLPHQQLLLLKPFQQGISFAVKSMLYVVITPFLYFTTVASSSTFSVSKRVLTSKTVVACLILCFMIHACKM